MKALCFLYFLLVIVCAQEFILGTAKPFKEIEISGPESGIISKMTIKEGDYIQQRQPIIKLDSSLLKSSLKVAIGRAKLKGTIQVAEAEVASAEKKLTKILNLKQLGHIRDQEVDKSQTEVTLAKAKLLSVRENLRISRYEAERIQKQIYLRTIRSPASGIIREVLKNKGESVSPNELICKLVVLDPIRIVAYPRLDQAIKLKMHQKIKVLFLYNKKKVAGEISFIDPVTDAASNTVRIIVEVANRDKLLRTGVRCHILTR